MAIIESFDSCSKDNFVSYRHFDVIQSINEHCCTLFFEDGEKFTNHLEWLENEDRTKEGWSIKFTKDQIDKKN